MWLNDFNHKWGNQRCPCFYAVNMFELHGVWGTWTCTHHRQNLSPHVCMDVLGFLFGLSNLRGLGMKNQHASVVFKVTASRICGDVFGSCVLKWIRWKESLVLKRKCWLWDAEKARSNTVPGLSVWTWNYSQLIRSKSLLAVVLHTFNPSIWETRTGELLELRPA